MKLNKIFTIATLAASALFATSCSDNAPEYAGPGSWDANANYADVYFPVTSKTDMVDPTAETIATVQVARRNVKNAATVPVKVVEGADVFTVSNAEFAAGDTTATITIDYSKAEIGKACKLVMTLEGADYVSSYSTNTAYTYTVTRVKWNSIGTAKFTDAFWFEETWDVEVFQRDDDKSYYRIMDPFKNCPYVDELDGSQSEYLELHVLKKGDKIGDVTVSESDIVDWYRLSTGYVHSSYGEVVWAINAKNFTNYASMDYYTYNRVSARLDDGSVGQIQLAPYWYMFGVGGWNYLEEPTIFINFPGFVEEYTASLDDYDWEPVFTGEYTSTQLGTKKDGVTLYKGVPNDSIEEANPGCFERYVAKNGGTPYVIEAPYTNGYDLYFLVKNSNVLPLVDSEYDYTYQYTGMNALNQKVYANILASSKFSESEVNLDIQFQTVPNKAGEFTDYGTATETLANITWSQVGTGTYTYTVMFDEPTPDPGYIISKRDDRDDTFKVSDWFYGADLTFTWDQKTNLCTVPEQFSGYVSGQYGECYVSDLAYYTGDNSYYEDYPCYYDAETSTFHFTVVYFVSAGRFGIDEETLEVEWNADGSARVKSRASKKSTFNLANVKLVKDKKIKKANHFVGKQAKASKFGRSLGTPQMGNLVAE